MKALIVLGLVGVVLAGAFGLIYMNMYNLGVQHETSIEAQVSQNQNKYSEFTQTAVEQMGIAREYQGAVKDVLTAAIEGRFGEGGSNAMFQAFTEAYPAELDPRLYERVMQTVEAGRRDFSNEQKMLISKVQAYKLDLRSAWSGMWLGAAGFPNLDLADPQFNPVVTSQTRETFQTGTDEGIKF